MNTRIFATKVTVSSALAIALALGTTSIAVAQPLSLIHISEPTRRTQ